MLFPIIEQCQKLNTYYNSESGVNFKNMGIKFDFLVRKLFILYTISESTV